MTTKGNAVTKQRELFLSEASFFKVNGLPAGYVGSVKHYFEDCRGNGLPPLAPNSFVQVMEYWKGQVQENKIAASTFNLRLTAVSRTLETWAISEKPEMYERLHRARKAMKRIKLDKRKTSFDWYTPQELKLLRKVAGEKTELIIEVLQVTGCRVSEAIGITLASLQKKAGVYRVKILGKGNRQRVVFLPAGLVKRCREVFKGEKYLLETANGKQYLRQEIATLLSYAGEKAGQLVTDPGRAEVMRAITPHKLRHSFATNALSAGKDLATISRYLGHSTVKVTADYYDHRETTPEEIFSVYGLEQ